MSVTFGFYNSSNGDRKYNARQISSIFDGIIQDGIFQNYGNHFDVNDARAVSGTNSMKVYVDTGRAWLNHTWTLNDTILALNIAAADLSNPRIDTVVIEVNETTRSNSIKVVKGTAAASPLAPTLTNTDAVHQYPLANIAVKKGVTSISLSDITNRVGQSSPNGTPFVTGLFETMSIDSIVANWEAQWEAWIEEFKSNADDAIDSLLEQYTNDNDARLIELLSVAMSHSRNLRVFNRNVPPINGSSKTFSAGDQSRDLSNDIYPSENIQVGDYFLGTNGYVAKLTSISRLNQESGISSLSVIGTGVNVGFGNNDEGSSANLNLISMANEDDADENGSPAFQNAFTTLELESSSKLKVKFHNIAYSDGLCIKVQKLTGRSRSAHRWVDDPIGFATAKALDNSKYANIPTPSWMPNSGVLQTRFPVTSEHLSDGLIIDPSVWLLDAMKPILLKTTPGESVPDQSDSLSGFSDGSYVALIGEYLSGVRAGRIAYGRKYSLDVRYRFVLSDSEGNTIGTTRDALSIPYKTFWNARHGIKRHVDISQSGNNARLTGTFRIVAN